MGFVSGIYEKMFGSGTSKQQETRRFEMISQSDGVLYNFGSTAYESDVVRSAIRPFVKAAGKMTAKHILDNGDIFKAFPNVNIKFLLEDPNPLMCGQVLQEKVATQYKLNNNAFIYIKRDKGGRPVELWPIPAISVEAKQDDGGKVFLEFYFSNGKHQSILYSDIIHLRNDFNSNDIFGDKIDKALLPLMDIVSASDKSIVQAVKNGAIIRWILKFTTVLKQEDIDQRVEDFTNNYLAVDSSKSVIGVNNGTDLEQVKSDSYVPETAKSDAAITRVWSLFGVNKPIVEGTYNEDQWVSYYESELEPYALQMKNEYTRKLFTMRERSWGNTIFFEASNLQHASLKTKLALKEMADRGGMNMNEWRKIMNWGPCPGGEDYIRRLDTAVVDKDENESEGGE